VAPRRRPHKLEQELRAAGRLVAGVDEVGRGPLAGPVVACAIIMPPHMRAIAGVADSKVLTREERERLDPIIRARAIALGLGAASAREVERHNVYHATVRAMRRALSRLGRVPDAVLVDGRAIAALGWPHHGIVDGDARCYSIACASIVAKVTRDRIMRALAPRHPGYGWEHNVGYGTPEHWSAIDMLGLTRHHRSTFVRADAEPLEFELE
jgi:ribonuclease HII